MHSSATHNSQVNNQGIGIKFTIITTKWVFPANLVAERITLIMSKLLDIHWKYVLIRYQYETDIGLLFIDLFITVLVQY